MWLSNVTARRGGKKTAWGLCLVQSGAVQIHDAQAGVRMKKKMRSKRLMKEDARTRSWIGLAGSCTRAHAFEHIQKIETAT